MAYSRKCWAMTRLTTLDRQEWTKTNSSSSSVAMRRIRYSASLWRALDATAWTPKSNKMDKHNTYHSKWAKFLSKPLITLAVLNFRNRSTARRSSATILETIWTRSSRFRASLKTKCWHLTEFRTHSGKLTWCSRWNRSRQPGPIGDRQRRN